MLKSLNTSTTIALQQNARLHFSLSGQHPANPTEGMSDADLLSFMQQQWQSGKLRHGISYCLYAKKSPKLPRELVSWLRKNTRAVFLTRKKRNLMAYVSSQEEAKMLTEHPTWGKYLFYCELCISLKH